MNTNFTQSVSEEETEDKCLTSSYDARITLMAKLAKTVQINKIKLKIQTNIIRE